MNKTISLSKSTAFITYFPQPTEAIAMKVKEGHDFKENERVPAKIYIHSISFLQEEYKPTAFVLNKLDIQALKAAIDELEKADVEMDASELYD
jgi:hypothetical protein